MSKKKGSATLDIIILISETEIRELPISQETEEAVYTDNLTLPKADAQVRYFPNGGRAFVYGYTGRYLAESENITQLEKSTVLRNLFDYGATGKSENIKFYVMMAVLVLTIFLLRG